MTDNESVVRNVLLPRLQTTSHEIFQSIWVIVIFIKCKFCLLFLFLINCHKDSNLNNEYLVNNKKKQKQIC